MFEASLQDAEFLFVPTVGVSLRSKPTATVNCPFRAKYKRIFEFLRCVYSSGSRPWRRRPIQSSHPVGMQAFPSTLRREGPAPSLGCALNFGAGAGCHASCAGMGAMCRPFIALPRADPHAGCGSWETALVGQFPATRLAVRVSTTDKLMFSLDSSGYLGALLLCLLHDLPNERHQDATNKESDRCEEKPARHHCPPVNRQWVPNEPQCKPGKRKSFACLTQTLIPLYRVYEIHSVILNEIVLTLLWRWKGQKPEQTAIHRLRFL